MIKVDTGNNKYVTTWKVKWDTANLLQNNNTLERYLQKFLSNVQVEIRRSALSV